MKDQKILRFPGILDGTRSVVEQNIGVNDESAQVDELNLPGGPFEALLLDLDGVITDTASVHSEAWKQAFDGFLQRRSAIDGTPFVPFDLHTDYPNFVDGKPRDNGVNDFLASRGITLPHGDPTDAPGDNTVWAVGNSKNNLFVEILKKQGAVVYEGSVRFIKAGLAAGLKTAVVSSSANTVTVLESVNLLSLFEERVDGTTIIAENLKGKPAPDTFLLAAKRLGIPADKAVVVEDALAGVEAGRAGNFGLVIGVDRIGHADALKMHGADVVVKDLAELLSPAPATARTGD